MAEDRPAGEPEPEAGPDAAIPRRVLPRLQSRAMTDVVDGYVSQAHYAEHLWPIIEALPVDRRGIIYAPRSVVHEITRDYPEIRAVVGFAPSPSRAPCLCGGYQDLPYGRRPKVLVNHGAGQTYRNVESPSFAGGPGHEGADLFLCPNEHAAELEQARYGKDAYAVGCPKLDGWASVPAPEPGVVAVTFHWRQYVKTLSGDKAPESSWAWETWRERIAKLAQQRTVLGHCHPRARRELEAWWAQIGVEYVPRAQDLLARADTLILDNSSLGFEWAAIDRHTVWLRGADWRHTMHGLRFGDPLPGPELESDRGVGDLMEAIDERASLRWSFARTEVRERVYGKWDGNAAGRAAAILTEKYF